MTYYPTKPYNIATKYPEVRKNDHEDRVYLSRASDYMPPVPKYVRQKSGVFKNKASLVGFINSILP